MSAGRCCAVSLKPGAARCWTVLCPGGVPDVSLEELRLLLGPQGTQLCDFLLRPGEEARIHIEDMSDYYYQWAYPPAQRPRTEHSVLTVDCDGVVLEPPCGWDGNPELPPPSAVLPPRPP